MQCISLLLLPPLSHVNNHSSWSRPDVVSHLTPRRLSAAFSTFLHLCTVHFLRESITLSSTVWRHEGQGLENKGANEQPLSLP